MWQKCEPSEPGAQPKRFADIPPEQLAEPPLTPNDFEAVRKNAFFCAILYYPKTINSPRQALDKHW